MRNLFVDHGWFGRKLGMLAEQIEKWWVKHLVIPALTVLPVSVVLFHIQNSSAGTNYQESRALLTTIHKYSIDHPELVFFLLTFYLVIVTALLAWIGRYKKEEAGVDVVGLLTLFAVLEKIVGAKAKRFGSCAKAILAPGANAHASAAFEEITQPDQQIALLANGLHTFFDAVDNEGVSFKVTIAEIENGLPVGWFYFYPDSEPPRTPMKALQQKESSICYCIKRKKMIIIEGLAKEAAKDSDRHFVPRLPDDDEDGSLICYPIVHHYTGSVPYVVTIVADKKGYFKNNKARLYQWIFNHFALRIGLEHSLLLIKKGVHE